MGIQPFAEHVYIVLFAEVSLILLLQGHEHLLLCRRGVPLRRLPEEEFCSTACKQPVWAFGWVNGQRIIRISDTGFAASLYTFELVNSPLFGITWRGLGELKSWLIVKERSYGGLKKRVSCMHGTAFCAGGDRMTRYVHNYGLCYARAFERYRTELLELSAQPYKTGARHLVAEVGILRGTGLAMWSNLFPGSEIHGFDIDVSTAENDFRILTNKGAVTHNIQLHTMDQFSDNKLFVGRTAAGGKFSIVIDDGYHDEDSIRSTFESFRPHLA